MKWGLLLYSPLNQRYLSDIPSQTNLDIKVCTIWVPLKPVKLTPELTTITAIEERTFVIDNKGLNST